MAVLGGAEATAVLPLLLSISISWLGDWGSGEGPVRIYVFVVEKGHQTRLWPLLALNSPFGVRPLEKKRKRTVKPV